MCTIEEEEGREMMGEVENGEVVGRKKVEGGFEWKGDPKQSTKH